MMTTIAAQLANHFHEFDYRKLPQASQAAVKRLLLDYLGVRLPAARPRAGASCGSLCSLQAASRSIADRRCGARACAQAAFANAISSHSIELDDIDVLALFISAAGVFSRARDCRTTGRPRQAAAVALAAGCEMMDA